MNTIVLTQSGTVAILTINRPEKLNALNRQTLNELHKTLEQLKSDTAVRCVIITGSGTKAFVAGADIAEFADFNQAEGTALSREGHDLVFSYIEQYPKPVIAAVNGFALGGGLELALSCHIRLFSDTAKVGLPEVTLGLIPGYGGTQRLAQLIGKGKATELICTAEFINAQDALAWGIANALHAPDQLMAQAQAMAERISKNSPTAIGHALQVIQAGHATSNTGLQAETQHFGACFTSQDFKEGVDAFLNKRKPDFKGA
jgi:enoyl-CoA hydratase